MSAVAEARPPSSASQADAFKFVSDLAKELSAGRVDLPSFPDAAARVQQVLSDDAVTSERIARVISADAGMTARVLTMANSTMLHRGGPPVTDLKLAITRIGHDHIRTAALAYATAQLRRAADLAPIRPQLEQYWEEGIRVASMASSIAKESRSVRADEAMLAGLLHNIGKVYLLARAPRTGAEGGPALDPGTVQTWYPSIGQALIENWKLPEEVAAAVGGQLDLERMHEGSGDLQDLLVMAVCLVSRMPAPGSKEKARDNSDLGKLPAVLALGLTDSRLVRVLLGSQTEFEMLQAALG